MDKKKVLIISGICLIIIILIIVFGNVLYHIGNKSSNIELSNTVLEEESKTKDINDVQYEEIKIYDEDGLEINLSDSKNKPVMLLFWNEENDDSVKVLKKVDELYKSYEGQIDFYMISTSKNVSKELKKDISIKIYYDLDEEAQKKYNINELPSMIYISDDNEVFNAKSGFTTTDSLEANLDILSDNI